MPVWGRSRRQEAAKCIELNLPWVWNIWIENYAIPDCDYLQHTSHTLPRQIFIWIFTNHDISSDRYRSNDHLNASTDQLQSARAHSSACLAILLLAAESWRHGIVLMRSSDQTWRHITSRAGRHIWSPLEIMVIVLTLYQLSADARVWTVDSVDIDHPMLIQL